MYKIKKRNLKNMVTKTKMNNYFFLKKKTKKKKVKLGNQPRVSTMSK